MVVPDADLLEQAAQGSREAFAVLYDRHDRRIYDFCLRLTGSPHDAADATQETFLAVLRRVRSGGEPIDDVQRYLCTAARHASYRLLERRRRVDLPGELPETPGGDARDGLLEPEQAALIASQQEDVRRANDRLPARYREVLALREVEGRSYERIGATLGLAENAVAQLIWRARVRLRTELRHGAVASIVPRTEDCERALGLIVAQDDGELRDLAEVAWLNTHLDECDGCRLARTALVEVGSSYRALVLPALLLAGLREQILGHHAAATAATAGASAAGAGGGGWAAATLTRITKLGHLVKGSPFAATGAVAGSALILGIGATVLNGGTSGSKEVAATAASRIDPLVAASLGSGSSAAGVRALPIATTEPAGADPAATPPAGGDDGLGGSPGTTFGSAPRETLPGAGVGGTRRAGGRRPDGSGRSGPGAGNSHGSSFAGGGTYVPRPAAGPSGPEPPASPPSGAVPPPTVPDPPVWKPPGDPPLDGSPPPLPEPPDVTPSPAGDPPSVEPPPVADPPVTDPSQGTGPPSSGSPSNPPPSNDPPPYNPPPSTPPPSNPPSSDPPPYNPPPSTPPPSNPPPSTPPPSNPPPSDPGQGSCHPGGGHHGDSHGSWPRPNRLRHSS